MKCCACCRVGLKYAAEPPLEPTLPRGSTAFYAACHQLTLIIKSVNERLLLAFSSAVV